MRITLSQLRVFEATVRLGSISKAAAELGIRQPSASTQLRALEAVCRSKLIDRRGHDIRPSRVGRLILPQVKAVKSLTAEIERALDEEANLKSGVLKVGYSAYQYAIPVISQFLAAHPSMKIEALSMATRDLLGRLVQGEIDLALITAQSPPEGVEAIELVRTEIVLAIPLGHPLAERGVADWSEIADLPIVRREEASATRMIFDRAAERAGISLKLVLDLGSWGSMRSAVEAGIGGCVALLGEANDSDSVAVLRLRDEALWASQYLVCLPQMRDVAAVEALVQMALKEYDGDVTAP